MCENSRSSSSSNNNASKSCNQRTCRFSQHVLADANILNQSTTKRSTPLSVPELSILRRIETMHAPRSQQRSVKPPLQRHDQAHVRNRDQRRRTVLALLLCIPSSLTIVENEKPLQEFHDIAQECRLAFRVDSVNGPVLR